MQTLLRSLLSLLAKIKREVLLLDDPLAYAQLKKVDREVKKLRAIIENGTKK